MDISICIATYRRPDRLLALLGDLGLQKRLPREVVVVDNDALGSARSVVEGARKAGTPFPIRYAMQTQKNISITRNQTVAIAEGAWLAFIDDDERAPTNWLDCLADAATCFGADAVLGPVRPVLPRDAPRWMKGGSFYHWERMRSGTVVPLNLLRFGNVMIRSETLRRQVPAFDPAYGLTGGEDGDLLTRLVQDGARIVWCDEAAVDEPIERSRLSLRWLLLRSLRGGQDFARHRLAGRYGPMTAVRRFRLFGRAALQMVGAALLAVLCWPLGRRFAAHWLTKVAANLGKLSTMLGLHYQEYR
jgi:succinoglycan biosynthesis protein ExoM